jgi:type I restriction enzyme S subunit
MSRALQRLVLHESEQIPLPPDWQWHCLEDIAATVKPGKLYDEDSVREEGGVPVVNQSADGFHGFHDEEPGVVASPEEPVFTFANHTCEMRLMTRPYSCIQNVFSRVGKPGVSDTRFLYYASLGRLTVSGYRGHHPIFRSQWIPLPPLVTQRRIASRLAAFDDLIGNNQRRIQLLEQATRLLYREWFVHLRFPGYGFPRGSDRALEEWETTSLGQVASLVRGRTYASSDLAEVGGRPFVNLKCIARHGGFRLDGLKRFVGRHKDEQVVVPGDIVMAVTDLTRERHVVAHAARVPAAAGEEAVFSMDTVKVIPGEAVNATWFYYWLRYSRFSREVSEHATGTNVLHLSPKQITAYVAAFPPRPLQDRFAEFVSPIDAKQDNLLLQIGQLVKARDLLLPCLMSGGITA